MTGNDPLPRVSFEVTRELLNRLNEKVPWGLRSHLLRILIEMIMEVLDEEGDRALGFLLAGRMKLRLSDDDDEE